jgi:aminoglycoside 3-N-acetyltransferase
MKLDTNRLILSVKDMYEMDNTKAIFQDSTRKYFLSDIVNALHEVNVNEGDTVFIQSDLGKFGKLADIKEKTEYTKYFLNACMKTVGKNGTIIFPTFTTSFCRNGFFDYYNSPSELNYLTELARLTEGFTRSENPIFSVTAFGPRTKELIDGLSNSCLGKGSIFDRLHKTNVKIVLLGYMEGTTFIHHIEEQCKVPYRFDKIFKGKIKKGNLVYEKSVIYNVRDLQRNPIISLHNLHIAAEKNGILHKSRLGLGYVMCTAAKDLFNFTENILQKDPLALLINP